MKLRTSDIFCALPEHIRQRDWTPRFNEHPVYSGMDPFGLYLYFDHDDDSYTRVSIEGNLVQVEDIESVRDGVGGVEAQVVADSLDVAVWFLTSQVLSITLNGRSLGSSLALDRGEADMGEVDLNQPHIARHEGGSTAMVYPVGRVDYEPTHEPTEVE